MKLTENKIRFIAGSAVVLLYILFFVLVPNADAQRANVQYVQQFPGATVGEKLTAAQNACVPNIECFVIFDSTLSNYAAGVTPSRCATCQWADFRTLPPTYTPPFPSGTATGCVPDPAHNNAIVFLDGAGNCTSYADITGSEAGGISQLHVETGGTHDFFDIQAGQATFNTLIDSTQARGVSLIVTDTSAGATVNPVGLKTQVTGGTNTGRAVIAQQTIAAFNRGSADLTSSVIGHSIENNSNAAVNYLIGLDLSGWDDSASNYVAGIYNQGTSTSDGETDGVYTNWASINRRGKHWFGGDIVLQPEATNAPWVGNPAAGGMSEVTCDSTQRGRIHYKNSGAGVADVPEVCAKTAADGYAWLTLGGNNTGGVVGTAIFSMTGGTISNTHYAGVIASVSYQSLGVFRVTFTGSQQYITISHECSNDGGVPVYPAFAGTPTLNVGVTSVDLGCTVPGSSNHDSGIVTVTISKL